MKQAKRSLISREGHVRDWRFSLYTSAESAKQSRWRDSARYLTIEGDLTEPVNGVAKFEIQLMAEEKPILGDREIPCVGSILRVKPVVQAGATLTHDEFQSTFLLANSGNLRSVWLCFQQPRYGHGLIAKISFSSRPPEDEDPT